MFKHRIASYIMGVMFWGMTYVLFLTDYLRETYSPVLKIFGINLNKKKHRRVKGVAVNKSTTNLNSQCHSESSAPNASPVERMSSILDDSIRPVLEDPSEKQYNQTHDPTQETDVRI